NIMRKLAEAGTPVDTAQLAGFTASAELDALIGAADDIWELVFTAARLSEIASQVIASLEPATLAKHAFLLAQRFSLFYHRYRIISEEDPARRLFYLEAAELARRSL